MFTLCYLVKPFQTKFAEAAEMLTELATVFTEIPILVVPESWLKTMVFLSRCVRRSVGACPCRYAYAVRHAWSGSTVTPSGLLLSKLVLNVIC